MPFHFSRNFCTPDTQPYMPVAYEWLFYGSRNNVQMPHLDQDHCLTNTCRQIPEIALISQWSYHIAYTAEVKSVLPDTRQHCQLYCTVLFSVPSSLLLSPLRTCRGSLCLYPELGVSEYGETIQLHVSICSSLYYTRSYIAVEIFTLNLNIRPKPIQI